MKPIIYIETSCIEVKFTGIGKTIPILVETLNQLGFSVEYISPIKLNRQPSFSYYNYYIPQYCKDKLSKDDIFLIPNNMGKFWRLPHRRTWILMHDLIPLSRFGYSGLRKLFYRLKTREIRHADRIITISNYVKKDLCDKLKVDDRKIKVLYWPITIPNIPAVERNKLQFLSVGTGEPRKYVEFLIENWAAVAPSDSKLLLYGGEWKKGVSHRKLKNLIVSNGLSERVELLGRVSDQELSRLYASSQGFIYPSLEEGFGLPPLESLSQGCDIVLPKTPINFELYSSIAYFYSSGDVQELKSAISKCDNTRTLENVSYSKKFDIEAFKQNIKQVFKYE